MAEFHSNNIDVVVGNFADGCTSPEALFPAVNEFVGTEKMFTGTNFPMSRWQVSVLADGTQAWQKVR